MNYDIPQVSLYNKYTSLNELSGHIQRETPVAMQELTNSQKKVLNKLFWLAGKYRKIYVSQTTLATWLGYSRQQINRAISQLANLGIIKKVHRTYDTCIYLVHEFFKQSNTKAMLKKYFPAIVKLSFAIGELLWPPHRKKIMNNDNNNGEIRFNLDSVLQNKRRSESPSRDRETGRVYNASYHKTYNDNSNYEKPPTISTWKRICNAFNKPETPKTITREDKSQLRDPYNLNTKSDSELLRILIEQQMQLSNEEFEKIKKLCPNNIKAQIKACMNRIQFNKAKEKLNY